MPKLFFSAADLPELQRRSAGSHLRYFAAMRQLFDRDAANPPPPLQSPPDLPAPLDAWTIEPWSARLINASILAAVTQDAAIGAQASQWLLDACRCRPRTNNSYTYGFAALALAAGYDLLHPFLDAAARQTVAAQLAGVCQGLYDVHLGVNEGWWRNLYLHHDCLIPAAGLGIAALALADEHPDWRTWYDSSLQLIRLALSMLGEDGFWPEGVSGWCYLMSALLPLAEAARNANLDDLFAFPWLAATGRARLALMLPMLHDRPSNAPPGDPHLHPPGYFFYGDGYRHGHYHGTGSTAAWQLRLLARRYRDPHVQWLADREAPFTLPPDPLPPSHPHAEPPLLYDSAWSFLFYDMSVPSIPSSAPANLSSPVISAATASAMQLETISDNLGYIISRTGWGAADALLTFRAGSVTGRRAAAESRRRGPSFARDTVISVEHAHMDQNAISFFYDGVYWLSPPGYAARYSARHATLLIDGRQQHRTDDACLRGGRLLRHERTPSYTYLLGDATAAYPPEIGLLRFHRHIVWLHPHTLILCDDVRAQKPISLQWRMPLGSDLPPAEQLAASDHLLLTASAPTSATSPPPPPPLPPRQMSIRFLLSAGDDRTMRPFPPTTQAVDEPQQKVRQRLLSIPYCGAETSSPAASTLLLTIISPPTTTLRPLTASTGVGVIISTPAGAQAIVFHPEPLCPPDSVRLSFTLDATPHLPPLIVGLPAAADLSLDRQPTADGGVSFTLGPSGEGREARISSNEGTMVVE